MWTSKSFSKGFFFLMWLDVNRFFRPTSTSYCEEMEQTSKQLHLSWSSLCCRHATRCRGSWTAQTRVVLHMLVHMFNLLHLMQNCREQKNAGSTKNIGCSKRLLSQLQNSKLWRCILMLGRTSPPYLQDLRFALSCVQSCQENHEGTVRHVSKSKINVIIWPITLWNKVLLKLFCF